MLQLIAAVVFSFTCQPAIRDGWLCCSTPRAQAQTTSFACPSSNQVPVITAGGGNQFCQSPGQMGGQCPQNAFCLAAQGQNNLFICCINNGATTTPVCPNNGVPQQSGNGFVNCGFNPSLCSSGFQCMTAANDPNTRLCCSQSSSAVVCPNNQNLLTDTNGQPRLCLPSQPNACPAGYSCQGVLSPAGSFACCTNQQGAQCPNGFQADISSNGANILCDRSQPASCPANSVCLLATNNQVSLCCRPSTAPILCPNGQSALLDGVGSVQQCTGPGTACPSAGYQCTFSNILSQYICCGTSATTPAVCADGRQTFTQTSGTTYTCNPAQFLSNCPFGYDCAQSTQIGISVCCFTNSATTITPPNNFLQCPNGWNPFRNSLNQQVQYCASTTDQSCPTGYSCTPASQVSVYLCCRLASSPSCPTGTTLLSNGQPRLCSRNLSNQCPRGYTCQQSTTATITICCPSQFDATILCADLSQPAMLGPNARFCPLINSNAGCPAGYTCQRSNQGANLCCLSTFSPVSMRFSSSTSQPKCPNGVIPSMPQRSCITVADCPTDSTCSISSGANICCATTVPPDTRCRARRTLLQSGKPVACLAGSGCSLGYECSFETSNNRAICCESPESAMEICPENRAAFLVARTEELMYCDGTAFTCPNGQECVISKDGLRSVCCSPIARCPSGTSRPFGEAYPVRCFTSESCPPEQACVSSTVDDVRVCCNVLYQDEPSKQSPTDDEWVVIEG